MNDSPSIQKIQPAGLKSPTVISLQFAGWLLFCCLWLPLCRGCNGGADKIPIQTLDFAVLDAKHLSGSFLILGSYSNGLIVAFSTCLAAWFVSEKLWRICLFAQFYLTASISIVVMGSALIFSDNRRDLVETTLAYLPPLVGLLIWIGGAIHRKAYPVAWARLQHAWTVEAYFLVHLMMLFQGTARYGYWVTMVGLACVAIAVEIARHRMKHDLWDASEPIVRPQFSIRNILFWTAFFPIVLSYYQAIPPVCDWLFTD